MICFAVEKQVKPRPIPTPSPTPALFPPFPIRGSEKWEVKLCGFNNALYNIIVSKAYIGDGSPKKRDSTAGVRTALELHFGLLYTRETKVVIK